MLVVEINEAFIRKDTPLLFGRTRLLLSPPLDEDYWLFRVKLHEVQSLVAFPKFGSIGIGFAQEADYNVNLPSHCDARQIFDHIQCNKRYAEISDEMCLEAIRLLQQAINRAELTGE